MDGEFLFEALKAVDLFEKNFGFLLEEVTLNVVVGGFVFAGAKLEVEVAEVFVDDVQTLPEMIKAGFRPVRVRMFGCGPEDVGQTDEAEENRWNDGEEEHYLP